MAKRQRKRIRTSNIRNRTRRKPPLVSMKDGNMLAECPFCAEKHPVDLTGPAYCGTVLELVAVQTISTGKSIKCILCGESGQTMVKVGDAYRHVHACSPGNMMYDRFNAPKVSLFAKLIWQLPDSTLKFIAAKTGKTPVELFVKDAKTGERIETQKHVYGWQEIT